MSRRRRVLIFGSIAAVVIAGVLAGRALADSSSQVASFRTANVKRGTVTQTEERSGIIEPVAAGTVAFPISGVVTSVGVQPGQAVTAGQTLAALDTSTLQAQLTAQQATLAAAQLTLANALNGVSSTPTNGSSNGSSSASRSSSSASSNAGRSSSSSNGAAGSSSASLGPARQAVASGQQRVDGALSAAQTALSEATSSCGTPSGAPTSSDGTAKHQKSSSSASTTSTTTPSPQQSGASPQCTSDLQAALTAQQQLAGSQSDLAKAESTLDALLSKATPSASSASAAPVSTPSLSGPTSADLVADQSAADAAQANVTAAQQNLAQATIVSPIDGTVAAVNMKVGDHVSAASSTENVIVVGPGGYEVTTTVPVTDIGNVKLADAASVVPDGSASAIDGKVVSIGVVPTTSGSTTSYPVVIGLNGSPDGLRNGGSANVTITLNQVNDALAVPTSAVRTAGAGAFHIVQVLSGGKTQTTPVQVGAVGPDLTEIKSGLQEGQQVVIADLNAPLPSNTTTRLGGAGGALGGGGGAFGGATIGRGG